MKFSLARFQKTLVRNRVDFLAKSLFIFIAIVSLALFSAAAVDYLVNKASLSNMYNKDEYHIVFLDNNLFYFCKFEDVNTEFVNCNDPYYLVRKQEEVAEGKREDKTYIRTPKEEEIYQPEGPIVLRKDSIVYISKVGNESAVMEYINKQ